MTPPMTATLALGVWRLVVAIKHRRELAYLADLDDRMLADIGLTRSDLRDAYSEPPWQDSTSMLARRAGRAPRPGLRWCAASTLWRRSVSAQTSHLRARKRTA
jgi:uncharacterized protein YjiS (DUF1127 family)